MSTHFVAVFVLAAALLKWGIIHTTGQLGLSLADQVAIVAVAAGLMLVALTRRGLLTRGQCVATAPWALVVGALFIHMVEQWQPIPAGGSIFGISWVCIWIIGYPLVGPRIERAWPSWAAVAAGLAVMTPALVLGLDEFWGWQAVILWFTPQCIAALAATMRIEKLITSDPADRMGSYRLLERLGGGGMGEVFKAEHRVLRTPAAIKVIQPDAIRGSSTVDRRGIERRFWREAQATSGLCSPHTVQLYDFGSSPDGRYFYAMELLDGIDLDTLVYRFGPIEAGRVVYLLRQICLSLAEAHTHGLVHRDIKPANVLICRAGVEVDFVKVVDFGLVAALQRETMAAAPVGDAKLTAAGAVTGTPAYMSPEAATAEPMDHRADLYSLGVVASWLLTGELLFSGTAEQQVYAHAFNEPTPPSQRTELEVPADLEAVILSCLAKSADARPDDAMVLLQRLDACECATQWTQKRAQSWWRSHLPR